MVTGTSSVYMLPDLHPPAITKHLLQLVLGLYGSDSRLLPLDGALSGDEYPLYEILPEATILFIITRKDVIAHTLLREIGFGPLWLALA